MLDRSEGGSKKPSWQAPLAKTGRHRWRSTRPPHGGQAGQDHRGEGSRWGLHPTSAAGGRVPPHAGLSPLHPAGRADALQLRPPQGHRTRHTTSRYEDVLAPHLFPHDTYWRIWLLLPTDSLRGHRVLWAALEAGRARTRCQGPGLGATRGKYTRWGANSDTLILLHIRTASVTLPICFCGRRSTCPSCGWSACGRSSCFT